MQCTTCLHSGIGCADTGGGGDDPDACRAQDDRIQPPALSRSDPVPDPAAQARKRTGIGIGLGDDLRAIRTSLIKAHLAQDFSAAFDLSLFQMARAVFRTGYQPHALDISVVGTPDRPPIRGNDERFAEASRGEGLLQLNRSILPLDWLEMDDDGQAFRVLRDLPGEAKQSLFAACVARTVKGQLAFEPSARPELEATVARLDIDFAGQYRPDADLFWSRLNKARILDIASRTLGPDWAGARAKSKKTQIVASIARAFADDARSPCTPPPPAWPNASSRPVRSLRTRPRRAPPQRRTPPARWPTPAIRTRTLSARLPPPGPRLTGPLAPAPGIRATCPPTTTATERPC